MDKRTEKALRGSIKKWFRIAYNRGKDFGSVNCDLCELFVKNDGCEGCDGCPVFINTGYDECQGSPWEEWNNYLRITNRQHIATGLHVIDEHSQKLAIAEYEFLKSLLPGNK